MIDQNHCCSSCCTTHLLVALPLSCNDAMCHSCYWTKNHYGDIQMPLKPNQCCRSRKGCLACMSSCLPLIGFEKCILRDLKEVSICCRKFNGLNKIFRVFTTQSDPFPSLTMLLGWYVWNDHKRQEDYCLRQG